MSIKQHIDAPLVPLLFFAGGIIILVLGLVPPISIQNSIGNWIGGVLLIACGTIFLRTSLKGKVAIWDNLLQNESINSSGQYLDVGCGNGLVMFKVAEHLKSGNVTGIDIWNSRDQSHNSQQSVTSSIKEHSLENKVKVLTADMRKLPFGDHQFDGVMASFAIQNVKPASNREQTLAEISRVLKPNGQLIIVDTERKEQEYTAYLEKYGFKDIKVKKAGFNGWWGGPWAPSFIMTAIR